MQTAAVALALGHWPFSTPLLEMNPWDDDWLVAVEVIDGARNIKWPTEGT